MTWGGSSCASARCSTPRQAPPRSESRANPIPTPTPTPNPNPNPNPIPNQFGSDALFRALGCKLLQSPDGTVPIKDVATSDTLLLREPPAEDAVEARNRPASALALAPT